jgi:uncharacterized membrane protein YhaH (DUF805 family)
MSESTSSGSSFTVTLAEITTTLLETAISSVTTSEMPHPSESNTDVVDPNNPTGIGEDEHQIFVSAFLMLVLILIALNINRYLHSKNFHHISETAVYILLGFVVAIGWTALAYDAENTSIQLNSKFFYLVLLPPIIFEVS